MAAPIQISLEEIISMLLSRVDSLTANDENNKTKTNIIFRVLYDKGFFTKDDVLASVKKEYAMLKKLEIIKEEPTDEMYEAVTNGILQWITGDVEGIKKSMTDYEQKLKEYAKSEAAKRPKIEVAGANVLSQLDAARKGKGRLIV